MKGLRKSPVVLLVTLLVATLCAPWLVAPAIGGGTSAQMTLVLQPGSEGKDVGARSSDPTTNYGAAEWFYGIGLPSNGAGFVEFDLSSIPPGSLVLSAEISLWAEYRDGVLTLSPVAASWDEMVVTWSSQPAVVSPPMDVTYPISRGDPSGPCYWGCEWPFDIKDIVQYWVSDPANNHGLKIVGDTPGVGWLMASSDNSNPAYAHPKLTVQYDLSTAARDASWGRIKNRYR